MHPLQGETILIGRGTMNDIIILEPEMSRLHLKLVRSGTGYSVQDVGSTNGSKLNDVELTSELTIQPGDIIRIGQTITMYYTMTPDQLLDRRQATTVLQDRSDTGTVRLQTGAPRIPTLTDRLKATGVGTGLSSGALVNHLFMAYTRSDWETKVAPVFNRLYDAQMAVWVEQYLPVGSDDWRLAIDQARLECWGLIVIATFAAMRSPFVQQVVRHFNNREKADLRRGRRAGRRHSRQWAERASRRDEPCPARAEHPAADPTHQTSPIGARSSYRSSTGRSR
ncbi:MAG: FHA domain-containing protein [Chloroflexi bacterium]|nr:FHA domain-containing protein [Chloroflexota bacterium]